MVSRRGLLKAAGMGAAALGTGGWVFAGNVTPAQANIPVPPGLPAGIVPYLRLYQNWSGEIRTDAVWSVAVTTESQVVSLANWAYRQGYRLRPRGFSHNWSPLAVSGNENWNTKLLMVDTLLMNRISLGSGEVTVGAGASMDALLTRLDLNGRGLAHNPAPGDITVGGALAIGAHGAMVPADGETLATGHSAGSMSNLVRRIRAVVWDEATGTYVARSFSRAEDAAAVLMVHLGRAFITEVTLRTGPRQTMRCTSYVTIPASEILGTSGRTYASFIADAGRAEVIWFPYTRDPWLKVWKRSGWQLFTRTALTPYNYVFADIIPKQISDMIKQLQNNPSLAPLFASTQLDIVRGGLLSTLSGDLWGSGANLTRYVRPTTLRVTANGYAVLCARSDIQWVVSTFTQKYNEVLAEYNARRQYPVNGPMEIRVTGLDEPADCGVSGAVDPWLSASRRRPDRPEWTCAVWLDLLTFPGTPSANAFYTDIENWLFSAFDGSRAGLRVEWSKGWGYTSAGAWTSGEVIDSRVPQSLTVGQPAGTQFADAVAMLDSLDPHRIYSSPLLDRLLTA